VTMLTSYVWAPSQRSVWAKGKVIKNLPDGKVVLQLDGETTEVIVKHSECAMLDDSHLQSLDNLCQMNNLHEAPLLDMLRRRHSEDAIYTCCGDVLISLNPYKSLPALYANPLQFLTEREDDDDDGNDDTHQVGGDLISRPHIYRIADNALRAASSSTSQSIIVSGESGAGKTEASKFAMNFLIAANERTCQKVDGAQAQIGDHMKAVLLDSSVVFEAFGNAKTVRNDNSSRFGKFVKLQYTSDGRLVSAVTETFLLEKSRLVSVGKGERNYHVFYQMVTASPALSAQRFKILSDEGTTKTTEEDATNYVALVAALQRLGCKDVEALFSLVSTVLHLGNVSTASPSSGRDGEDPCSVSCSSSTMAALAASLGVPVELFLDCLCMQTMQAGKRASVTKKVLGAEDTLNNVYALLKYLYKSIFGWLLRKVNEAMSASAQDTTSHSHFIGILDIFGFEILQTNSFEQLCINYTNERLQSQFNDHIFVLEQEEYSSEGLNWNSISFRDNQPVIDLIGKKPYGILHILEEHGLLNRKPDDVALGNSLSKAHTGVSPNYSKSRFGNDGFVVRHFAGEVNYLLAGFISKNNDSLQEDLLECLAISTNVFLGEVLGQQQQQQSSLPPSPPQADATHLSSAVTVSYSFRGQLDALIATLALTKPHYVKCIKANNAKAPALFEAPLVMEQLRYSGTLEVVRIRREGYPARITFRSFYDRFAILAFKERASGEWLSPKDAGLTDGMARKYCAELCAQAGLPAEAAQTGKTRLFMRDGAMGLMQASVVRFLSSYATKIQSSWRRWLSTSRFRGTRVKVIRVQAALRMLLHRRAFRKHVAARIKEEQRIEAERRRLEALRIEQERMARLDREERERLLAAAAKLQKQGLVFLRRKRLQRRARQLHAAAAKGDIAAFKQVKAEDLDLLLYVGGSSPFPYRTLQHTALVNSQVAVLRLLGWRRASSKLLITALRDQGRNTILHLVAASGGGEGGGVSLAALVALSEAVAAERPPAPAPAPVVEKEKQGGAVLKSGWLSKKKEGNAYRRRWCVLTHEQLAYYKQPGDAVPKGVVPLAGCAFKRVYGAAHVPPTEGGAAFSLSSRNIKKPSFFGMAGGLADTPQVMYFLAESEAEALQWIAPTR